MVDDFKRGAGRAGERIGAAREAASERAEAAREAMGERAESAKDAVGGRAEAAREVMGDAREVMGDAREVMGDAREVMGERALAAREAAVESAAAAKDAAVEAIAAVKPRLRGVSHEWAFFVSLVLGTALIIYAKTPKATLAVAIYAVSLSALLGTSALYHRVNWKRPNARRWMRRIDHSMIFLLIAGTYTPFALLVLHGPLADAILAVVWIGALAGAIVEMVWVESPKWVHVIVYMSLGWVAVVAYPALLDAMGLTGALLLAAGGALYTAGAVVYATQRPDPNPAVFGYHEVFHLFVIAAAAVHFTTIALYALPASN